jgi:hypothetical protein
MSPEPVQPESASTAKRNSVERENFKTRFFANAFLGFCVSAIS